MNITEILKDAPKGTKLYSPLFGNVTLISATNAGIRVASKDGFERCFTQDGKMCLVFTEHKCIETEMVLFPSKENRDWSTFKVEPYFPTTYGECNLFLKSNEIEKLNKKIAALNRLIVCRDAWWKVDNNWKPDWDTLDEEEFVIVNIKDEISRTSKSYLNCILAFRTPEIRDKFFETFRDLIEQCKELI